MATKTTAGGTVISNYTRASVHGVPRAREGDKVSCPACKSTGVIQCVPPIRKHLLDGLQTAVEGDLCICGCNPPPRLVAGVAKNFASDDYYPEEVAASPLAMQWYASAGHDLAVLGHQSNQRFLVVDKESGKALADIPYRLKLEGQTIAGITDAGGMTEVVHSLKQEVPIEVHLRTQT